MSIIIVDGVAVSAFLLSFVYPPWQGGIKALYSYVLIN